MILEYKCSYYKKPFDLNPKSYTVELVEILKAFSDETYKNEIEYARSLYNAKDPKYSDFKKKLPAAAFSGLFHPTRSAANTIHYNGLVVLDLDHVGETIIKIKESLQNDPYVVAVWLSPSGDGLKFLIYTNLNKEDHKKIYYSALTYFDRKYDIKLDSQNSDISRLCYASYDPHIFLNEYAEKFDQIIELPKKRTSLVKKKNASEELLCVVHTKNDKKKKEEFRKIYHYLRKRNMSITSGRGKWVRVAFALSNSFSTDLGIRYFLELSRLDGLDHDEQSSRNLILSCYNNINEPQNDFSTIIFLAKEKGFDIDYKQDKYTRKKKLKMKQACLNIGELNI